MSFLTWAGCKKKQLSKITPIIKSMMTDQNVYIEPFLGSGCVLIDLLEKGIRFDKYVCSDLNRNLIITFKQVKYNIDDLIDELEVIEEEYNNLNADAKKVYYLEKRDIYNRTIRSDNDLLIASLFIFLNRTCFRGVYRVNKRDGLFKISFGNYKKVNFNFERLRKISRLFNESDVQFTNESYEFVLCKVDPNCIVYLDPPYFGTFDNYTQEGFDQSDFRSFLNELKKLGCKVILSNSFEYKPTLEKLGIFDYIDEVKILDKVNSKNPGIIRIELLAY